MPYLQTLILNQEQILHYSEAIIFHNILIIPQVHYFDRIEPTVNKIQRERTLICQANPGNGTNANFSKATKEENAAYP